MALKLMSVPVNKDQGYSFKLIPNAKLIGRGRHLVFYVVVFISLMVISYLFYHLYDLSGLEMATSLGFSLLLLVNLFLFYVRKIYNHQTLDLRINYSELQLLRSGILISSSPIDEIEMVRLSWLMNEDQTFMAIQLNGKNFPTISIGMIDKRKLWLSNRKIMGVTDFVVNTDRDWLQLNELFKGA
jgi:hypothetical protein